MDKYSSFNVYVDCLLLPPCCFLVEDAAEISEASRRRRTSASAAFITVSSSSCCWTRSSRAARRSLTSETLAPDMLSSVARRAQMWTPGLWGETGLSVTTTWNGLTVGLACRNEVSSVTDNIWPGLFHNQKYCCNVMVLHVVACLQAGRQTQTWLHSSTLVLEPQCMQHVQHWPKSVTRSAWTKLLWCSETSSDLILMLCDWLDPKPAWYRLLRY